MLISDGKKAKTYDFMQSCAFYMFAIVVTLVCQGLASVVAAAFARTNPDIVSDGDFNTAFMIFFQVANIAFIILYTRLKRRKLNFSYVRRGDTGVTPSLIIIPVVASAVLMIAMFLPTTWYGYLTAAMGIPEDAGAIELNTASSIVMIVIASVFLAPVCEETIYRGVLLHGLKSEFSAVKAVLLSSLAFMLMHMSPLQVVFQFALGALAACMALKSGRLLPSIILHACSNALALVIQLTPLDAALGGCVVWLTHNIAAAVFITLGLFVGGGAVLFALVRFGFDGSFARIGRLFRRGGAAADSGDARKTEVEIGTENESGSIEDGADKDGTDNAGTGAVGDLVNAERERIMTAARKKNGMFSYFVGIGICAVMFIINFVSMVFL